VDDTQINDMLLNVVRKCGRCTAPGHTGPLEPLALFQLRKTFQQGSIAEGAPVDVRSRGGLACGSFSWSVAWFSIEPFESPTTALPPGSDALQISPSKRPRRLRCVYVLEREVPMTAGSRSTAPDVSRWWWVRLPSYGDCWRCQSGIPLHLKRDARDVFVPASDLGEWAVGVQVRVGETHGVKFPREFGLLLKQLLYFDRYGMVFDRPSALSIGTMSTDRISANPSQTRDRRTHCPTQFLCRS
jgi:hypothetical protein